MEKLEITKEILEYLTNKKIEDFFPKDVFYPNTKERDNIEENFEVERETIDEQSNKKNYSFEKLPSIKVFEKMVEINFIKVFRNILIISGESELKLLNVNKYYELIAHFRLVEQRKILTADISSLNNDSKIYLAIGGELPSIYIIDLQSYISLDYKLPPGPSTVLEEQLIGHRNSICEIKFHPKYPQILLSASKDNTVRMWNCINKDQICIFGGFNCYLSDVCSIDWHISGRFFVSSSIDGNIKIFEINNELLPRINLSINNIKIKTLLINKYLYSCSEIHSHVIDCVRFNGNFIISKSVDGIIKEWMPIFNRKNDYFFLINTYTYKFSEKIQNFKFCFNLNLNLLLIGNLIGEAYLFSTNSDEIEDNINYFHEQNLIKKLNVK